MGNVLFTLPERSRSYTTLSDELPYTILKRIKNRGNDESNTLHKIWITGCPSTIRCAKTHAQGSSNPGKSSCSLCKCPRLAAFHDAVATDSSHEWWTFEAEGAVNWR